MKTTIFLIVLLIVIIALTIWFLVVYGNTPVGELPSWLWWLMK